MNSQQRIGDAEREAAITALGEHFADGRIDQDEYDERSTAAWEAKTAADLKPLFADLPDLRASTAHAGGETSRGSGRPAPVPPRRSRPSWFHVGRIVVVPLVVVLAVASLIPWFVVAVAAWLAWTGFARFAWGPRHTWRHRTDAYGRRGRW